MPCIIIIRRPNLDICRGEKLRNILFPNPPTTHDRFKMMIVARFWTLPDTYCVLGRRKEKKPIYCLLRKCVSYIHNHASILHSLSPFGSEPSLCLPLFYQKYDDCFGSGEKVKVLSEDEKFCDLSVFAKDFRSCSSSSSSSSSSLVD
mmetsp:Transcript_274/g.674  ORF Transcript_274/g.674 Transcript_274/m.674 type:complete len:147 (-) Transcript_274:1174-1614(-)